jgi:hypothetical protein
MQIRQGVMSNVIRLFDSKRGDDAIVPLVQIGIDGLQSLLENWSSITLSLE